MYLVSNWYWIVGGDEANVWSSAKAASVPIGDPDYQTWQQAGYYATNIASMDELEAVFAEHYQPGMLKTYNAFKRWQKEQAGITLESGMPIKTDDRAQAKITGVFVAAQELPTMTTPWSAADGTVHQLDATDIVAMNNELLTHINNCFSISADVLAQIDAGTITTREEIDAAFAAPISAERRDWLKKK
jgi:Domain of unknown function (DUF4376)